MYNVDLREALWGNEPVGARRLAALVYHLPPDSAVVRAVDPNEGWNQEHELLATVVDMIGENTRTLVAANTEKGTKLPEPLRFPRPWEEREREAETRAQTSPEAVRAFFKGSDMSEVTWSQENDS